MSQQGASTSAATEPSASPGRAGDEPVVVRGLNHFYGEGETRTQVLFDVDLELRAGHVVIMTGKSGSGKTTLLTLIGGLRRVQDGSARVLGRELRELNDKQLVEVRRGIGFIFQAHNLFASLSAHENVRMALELGNQNAVEMDARVTEILTQLGLSDRMSYQPARLSGGQRQRVAIARALVHKPRLVLADEPTAALDEHSSRVVIDLLHETAHRDGTTVMIVTHDTKLFDFADEVITMSYGRISV